MFEAWRPTYRFLNPAGHLGATPVTVRTVLPFTQVILVGFGAVGFFAGRVIVAGSCVSFTWTVGAEKVKPLADKYNQPSFSFTVVTAVCCSPPALTTEMVALTGASLNP